MKCRARFFRPPHHLSLRRLLFSAYGLLPTAFCFLPFKGRRPKGLRYNYCLLLSGFCLLLTPFCFPLSASQNPPATTAPPSRIEPKAQELLDRSIQALGGQAFLQFKSLTTRGRLFAISEGETSGLAPFESAVEYPDKRRFAYGKKKPVVLVNNGDRAWELDRYGITRQLPEQVRRWQLSNRYSLENLLRLRIHESGMLIQDGGVDFVDDAPTRVLDLIDAQQVHVKLYLHKVTFLPVRIAYRVQNPETREWDEYADVYGDYQKVREILTPMHITRFLDGERVSEIFRNSAQYDESYPSNYFEPVG